MEGLTALCLESSKVSLCPPEYSLWKILHLCTIIWQARYYDIPSFSLEISFPLKMTWGKGYFRAMLKMLHFIRALCFDNLFPSSFFTEWCIRFLPESPSSSQVAPSLSRQSSRDMEEITTCHLFRGRVTLEDLYYLYFPPLKILSSVHELIIYIFFPEWPAS